MEVALAREDSRCKALASIAAALLVAPAVSGAFSISILERCRQCSELALAWPALAVLMLHCERRQEVVVWLKGLCTETAGIADDSDVLALLQYISDWFPEELDAKLLPFIDALSGESAPYMVWQERHLFRAGKNCYTQTQSGTALPELLKGDSQLLVVHNIVDGLGDELIRCNALLQAILDGCPQASITLFTDRQFLYDHPRVRALPIKDTQLFSEELTRHWHGIIDFFEPYLPSNSYNCAVEIELKKHLEGNIPPFYIWARKDLNHYVIESVLLNGQQYAEKWHLKERRLPLSYETSMRLITELGLPLRFGEQESGAGWLLSALPEPAANQRWQSLLGELSERCNGEKRPVAILNVFGGQSSLKGFQKSTYERLHQIMAQLVESGFNLVLVPNGDGWGGPAEIKTLISDLPFGLKRHTIAAPLADAANSHESMRWIKYFASWSDLIVAVEGWMMHLAYALGKPYYLLMAPYSYGSEWHPHGRSINQGQWLGVKERALRTEFVLPDAGSRGVVPPLLHRPEKNLLQAALAVWGAVGDVQLGQRLLYWMGSEDKDIRNWVLTALGRIDASAFQTELVRALEDCNREVRSAAASALLAGGKDLTAVLGADWHNLLMAYQLLGQFRFQEVRPLGQASFRALRACLNRDESEVHRDATIMLESMERQSPAPQIVRGNENNLPRVLILTPVKDAVQDADGYFSRLRTLSYPAHLLSVGILESDSTDDTFEVFRKHCEENSLHFRSIRIWKKDFDYHIPADTPRWEPRIQLQRRTILARSRNHLLFHALDDEDWVLWLDSDVIEYPADIIERLLSYNKDIVQPHCVKKYCGPSFDLNAWRDRGRLYMHDLRPEGEITPIDAVGGTMLLIRADCHRDGLVFPPFLYGKRNNKIRVRDDISLPNEEGEVETEGLGILASDMNLQCWALPHLEIIHADR